MLALVVCNGWINEIIVAFLGPLPLSRRPESKPFFYLEHGNSDFANKRARLVFRS
jgi:hypothetical protein